MTWFVFALATTAFLSPEKSRGIPCVTLKIARREPQLSILVMVKQPTFLDTFHMRSRLLVGSLALLVYYRLLFFCVLLPRLSLLFSLLYPL